MLLRHQKLDFRAFQTPRPKRTRLSCFSDPKQLRSDLNKRFRHPEPQKIQYSSRIRVETTSNTFNFFEVSTHPILGHKFAGNIRAPLENFTTIIYKYYCRKHSSYISWKKEETLIVQVSTPLELPWPLPAELFHQNLKFLFFPKIHDVNIFRWWW